eukprot:10955576-Alexandrium_andersonii.AAC.1
MAAITATMMTTTTTRATAAHARVCEISRMPLPLAKYYPRCELSLAQREVPTLTPPTQGPPGRI